MRPCRQVHHKGRRSCFQRSKSFSFAAYPRFVCDTRLEREWNLGSEATCGRLKPSWRSMMWSATGPLTHLGVEHFGAGFFVFLPPSTLVYRHVLQRSFRSIKYAWLGSEVFFSIGKAWEALGQKEWHEDSLDIYIYIYNRERYIWYRLLT